MSDVIFEQANAASGTSTSSASDVKSQATKEEKKINKKSFQKEFKLLLNCIFDDTSSKVLWFRIDEVKTLLSNA